MLCDASAGSVRETMATTSRGVLPRAKTTSGWPWRRAQVFEGQLAQPFERVFDAQVTAAHRFEESSRVAFVHPRFIRAPFTGIRARLRSRGPNSE
jgi:hypothetical protein